MPRLTVLLTIVLLAAPSAASAATRYVTPTALSTSAPCSQAAPCTLASAIQSVAQPGDEVVVDAGTYPVATTISRTTGNISVRGADGARPRLTFSGGAHLELTTTGTLSNLELRGACGTYDFTTSACVRFPGTGTIDRLLLDITGDDIAGIDLDQGTVRNSAVRLAGPAGGSQPSVIAVFAHGPAQIRNVTAVATGAQSIGIAAGTAGFGAASYTTQVVNAVARGDRTDLGVSGSANSTITMSVTHSNYVTATNLSTAYAPGVTIAPTAPNQASDPAFVDRALPDYHPAAGSPLVDAGLDSPANGSMALDGQPRILGSGTDIGAYEFVPPTSPPASNDPPPAVGGGPPGDGAPATGGPASMPANGPTVAALQAELRAAVADDLAGRLPPPKGVTFTVWFDGLPPGTAVSGELRLTTTGSAAAAGVIALAKGTSRADAAGKAALRLRATRRGRAILRRIAANRKAGLIVRLRRPDGVQVAVSKTVKLRRLR